MPSLLRREARPVHPGDSDILGRFGTEVRSNVQKVAVMQNMAYTCLFYLGRNVGHHSGGRMHSRAQLTLAINTTGPRKSERVNLFLPVRKGGWKNRTHENHHEPGNMMKAQCLTFPCPSTHSLSPRTGSRASCRPQRVSEFGQMGDEVWLRARNLRNSAIIPLIKPPWSCHTSISDLKDTDPPP
ncbi:unnamed protein product [Leuciscus chuanchicus]